MSVYKRGKYYHYDFSVRGTRYKGSTKQTNDKKAEKVESVLVARAMEQGDIFKNRGSKTLDVFWKEFDLWLKDTRLEESSKTYYRNGWALLEATPIKRMRLDRITTDEASCVRIPGSASNVNKALRTLRRLLGKAADLGYIDKAPKIKLAKEQGRDDLIEPWMEEKLLKVMEFDREPTKKHSPRKSINYSWQPLRDVLLLMMDAGMRPAEVFRMRWDDVHFERLSIFVPREKRGKGRWVGLSMRCKEALAGRGGEVTADSGMPTIAGDGATPSIRSNFVFPAKRSESGHIETVQKQWARAKLASKIPDRIVLYCARHTYGTDALAGTGNLAAVMKSMGHSQTPTAMLYQHPDLSLVRDAIDKRNGKGMIQ